MTPEDIAKARKTGFVRRIDTGQVFIYNTPFDRRDDMVPCEGPTFKQVDAVKERMKEPVGALTAQGDPNRVTLIAEAIGKLDRAVGFNKDGRPKVDELTKLLGWEERPVGIHERDSAWHIFNGKATVTPYQPEA